MSEELKKMTETVEKMDAELTKTLSQHTTEIEKHGKASTELTGKMDELSTKLADAQAVLDDLAQKAAQGFTKQAEKPSTIGSEFMKSEQIQNFIKNQTGSAKVEIKNTIIGEGGSPQNPIDTIVAPDRLAGIVPGAFRSLNILDLIPMGVTSSNQIEYTQELAFTNNAAEAAEGTAKAQTDLTFQLINEPVRTIAHWIKLSKQVLDDAPMLEGYVNRRMVHGVQRRLQFEILRGTGTSPNLAGLSSNGRHTAFTPESGEIALDSLNRAKYAIIGADYQPDVIIMNPADFGAIERVKSTSSSNDYAAGNGAALSYINGGMTPMLWGLPVVTSNDVVSGKFYMMDSNAIQLFMRQGVTIEMFEQDTDNVQKNLLTIRGEMRGALAVYTPLAVRYGDLLI